MKEIIRILNSIKQGVDFENEKALVDDGLLDSFDIVMLIGELEEEYGIRINTIDIVPENFNSVEGLYNLVGRLLSE